MYVNLTPKSLFLATNLERRVKATLFQALKESLRVVVNSSDFLIEAQTTMAVIDIR